MTKSTPWQEKTKQPFENDDQEYTYIPRTSEVSTSGCLSSPQGLPVHGTYPTFYAPAYVQPAYPAQAYYQPRCYYDEYLHYQQHVPAQPQYTYLPRSDYYYDAPQPVFHQPSYHHPQYHQQHAYGDLYSSVAYTANPKQICGAPKRSSKALKDGTLPYYGRTAQEVQEDTWYEQRDYEHEVKKAAKVKASKSDDDEKSEKSVKSEAKSLEPKGKATDQYWVVHTDGGMRAYPLGTIKVNFEGEWKIDGNGWPYLVEK